MIARRAGGGGVIGLCPGNPDVPAAGGKRAGGDAIIDYGRVTVF